jgi:outer membrane protein TolC
MMVCGILLISSLAAAHAAADAGASPESAGEVPRLVSTRDFHTVDPQLEELMSILLEENPDIRSARAFWRSSLESVPQER